MVARMTAVTNWTISAGGDGNIFSIFQLAGDSPLSSETIEVPYEVNHTLAVNNDINTILNSNTNADKVTPCPFCSSTLHKTKLGHFCYNVKCTPRTSTILTRHMFLLGIPATTDISDIVDSTGLPLSNITLLDILQNVPHGHKLESYLSKLPGPDFLIMSNVPSVFVDAVVNYLSSIGVILDSITTVQNLFIKGMINDIKMPQDELVNTALQAIMMSLIYVNREYVESILNVYNTMSKKLMCNTDIYYYTAHV